MRVLVVACLMAVIGFACWSQKAAAGGLEYTGAGTQGLARGGAVTARAEDAMVLGYNPAGLAELRGTQVMLNANLAIMSACVDPIGYYGWGAYGGGLPSRLTDTKTGRSLDLNLSRTNDGPEGAYYRGKLDSVCLDEGLTPVPQIGLTARISEKLGVGIGMIFPSVTPQGRWGGDNGIIDTPAALRPAPTRYMLLRSGTLGMFPTLGVGYRVARWLRIGGSFEWGMINVDNTSMAAVSSGTSPSNDIIAHVTALDLFIPAFTASVHVVPIDAIDIVAAFRYQGDLDAAGNIELTTGLFSPINRAHTKTNDITSLHQKFPWKLRAGFRYADRLAPRPNGTNDKQVRGLHQERIHDAFEDERWDVELDLEYQMNSRHQDLTINYAPEQTVEFESLMGMVSTARFPDTSRSYTQIPKRWKDQVSLRVGGSYNILPGLFGVSAGVHFEDRGVDPGYMQLDYWPLRRMGLHVGVRTRVSRSVDVFLAYAHIFQETLVVAAPDNGDGNAISTAYKEAMSNSDAIRAIDKRTGAQVSRSEQPPVLEENPKPTVANGTADGTARIAQTVTKYPQGQPPWIINSGTYRSGFDIVSAGINVHF